jgi:hypothetical protein
MENLRIRCKSCNREIEGHPTRTIACGCSNMATIRGDKISAVDLSKVIMLNSIHTKERSGVLTEEDLAYQESRRQRKVRRLDFEVR